MTQIVGGWLGLVCGTSCVRVLAFFRFSFLLLFGFWILAFLTLEKPLPQRFFMYAHCLNPL